MNRLLGSKGKRKARVEEDNVPDQVLEITEFEVPTADGRWQTDHNRTSVRTIAAANPNANLAWSAPASDTSQSRLLDRRYITASTPSATPDIILREEQALDGWPRRLLHVVSHIL
jgi:hypothetical protein